MIHHSVAVASALLLCAGVLGHLVARTVVVSAELPDVTRLLLPVVGISLLALQLVALGLAHLPWTAPVLLAPWVALAALRHRGFARALGADARAIGAAGRAILAHGPLAVLLVAAIGVVLALDLVRGVAAPLTGWDAVAVWMLKAKVFYIEQSFSLAPLHADPNRRLDYPPLLPAWVDVLYTLAGRAVDTLGKAVDDLLLPLMAATIACGLRALAGLRTALLLALLATTSPLLVPFVSCTCDLGYADFAVAVLIVSALAHLAAVEAGDVRAAPGAVLAAALAALVKNEGLVVLVAIAVAIVLLRAGRTALRRPASWALPSVAVAGVVAWQIVLRASGLKPAYVGSAGLSPTDAAARAGVVLRYAGSMVVGGADYGWVAAAVALAVLLIAVAPARRWAVAAVVAAQLASYVAAFVVTPFPLEWQLGTSANRLVVQLLPSIVLAVGLALGPLLPLLGSRRELDDHRAPAALEDALTRPHVGSDAGRVGADTG